MIETGRAARRRHNPQGTPTMTSNSTLPTATSGPDPAQIAATANAVGALTCALSQFEATRGRKALLYVAEDRQPGNKPLDQHDVPAVYEAVHKLEPTDELDLILHTGGGSIATARRLLQLLHAAAARLTIFVPYKAHSAGTLLSLGAHELVLGPAAGLSPIDPQLLLDGTGSMYSSQDFAVLGRMARAWLGAAPGDPVTPRDMLPAEASAVSLAKFYRAEELVRCVAREALRYPLPQADDDTLEAITERLITGYADHGVALTCDDLTDVGLPVRQTTRDEERPLWDVWTQAKRCLDHSRTPAPTRAPTTRVNGVLLGPGFAAAHILQRYTEPNMGDDMSGYQAPEPSWVNLTL
jgi:hypothetical protein